MRLSKNALSLVLSILMIFSVITPAFAEGATEVGIVDRVKTEVADAQEILKDEKLVEVVKTALTKVVTEAKEASEANPVDETALAEKETALRTVVEAAKNQLALSKDIAAAEAFLKAFANKMTAESKKAFEDVIAKAKTAEKSTEVVVANYKLAQEELATIAKKVQAEVKEKVDAEKAADAIKKQIEELKKTIKEATENAKKASKDEAKNLEQLLLRQREQLRRLQKENQEYKGLDEEVETLKKTIEEMKNPKTEKGKKVQESRDKNFTLFSIGNPYYQVVTEGEAETKMMDVAPVIENGRTMLPLRYVAESLGFNVNWDGMAQRAEFVNSTNETYLAKTVAYELKTNTTTSDDMPVTLETGFKLINNRLFVSIRDITMLFGGTTGNKEDGVDNSVEWSQPDRAVFVYTYGGPLAKEEKVEGIDTVEVTEIKQGKPVRTSALYDDFNAVTIEAKVKKGADVDAKFYLVKNGKKVNGYRGKELVETVKGEEGKITFEIPNREINKKNRKDRFDILAVVGEDEKTFDGVKIKTEIPELNGYVTTSGHGYFLQVKAFMNIGKDDYYDAIVMYGDKRYRAGFDKDGNLTHEEIRMTGDEKYLYVRVADEYNNVKEFKFQVPVAGDKDQRLDVEKPEIGRDFLYIKTFGKDVRIDIEIYEKSTGYDLATMKNVRLNDEGWTMVSLFDYFGDNLKLDKDMIIKVKTSGAESYSYIYEIN